MFIVRKFEEKTPTDNEVNADGLVNVKKDGRASEREREKSFN